MTIERNIEFIFAHFDKSNLFPRKMMTKVSNGQFVVYSKEEIMSRCAESDYVDCRINAYPFHSTTAYESEVYLTPSPDFVFIDLDLSSFKKHTNSKKVLDYALRNTLELISEISRQQHSHYSDCSQILQDSGRYEKEKLSSEVKPTVLWTGNGYHIYLPIQSLPLDVYEPFSKENYPSLFGEGGRYTSKYFISELFLEYAEYFFTNGNADKNHRPTFKSCLIRIPGTFNSKCLNSGFNQEESKVKVIQEWNGHRLPIQLLTKGFRRWLLQLEVNQYYFTLRHRNYRQRNFNRFIDVAVFNKNNIYYQSLGNKNRISWIEKLLQTPLKDHRKFCLWRIFLPYLLNIQRLSVDETIAILIQWLKRSNLLREIDFDPTSKILELIRYVRNYLPASRRKLAVTNPEIYRIVVKF